MKLPFSLLNLIGLLLCCPLIALTEQPTTTIKEKEPYKQFRILPDEDLFAPLIADPRESQFSIRYERQDINEDQFTAASVSFGDYLALMEYQKNANDPVYQLSFDGAMYAIFNLDTESYDLINTNYLVGLSLSQRIEQFTWRLRLYHFSGHLGDEFIIDNPEFERENSSYEDLELVIAQQFHSLRLYGGGGLIVRSNSIETGQPWHLKLGAEWRKSISPKHIDVLIAIDWESMQRTDWKLSNSLLGGFTIARSQTREIRLMGGYYYGNSPHGQFFRDRISVWGLGIYFIV